MRTDERASGVVLSSEPSAQAWANSVRRETGYDKDQLYLRLLEEFKSANLIEWDRRFKDIFDFWFFHAFKSPLSYADNRKRREARKDIIDKAVVAIKKRDNRIRVEAKIELISMMLPNGKALGECTFGEVAAMTSVHRSFLERVSRQGRPKQKIKTVLDEARLLEIWNTGGANSRE